MSIVPVTYDLAREVENLEKSLFFNDLALEPFHRHFFYGTRMLPLSFYTRYFLNSPFHHLHELYHLIDPPLPYKNEKLSIDNNGFQLTFDTKDFKPYELNVRTVDNFVVVEGKHEERKDDHNFTKKHFSRTYLLPKGYNPEEVISNISSDGILSVKIPPPPPQRAIESKERIVRIKETGKVYSKDISVL